MWGASVARWTCRQLQREPSLAAERRNWLHGCLLGTVVGPSCVCSSGWCMHGVSPYPAVPIRSSATVMTGVHVSSYGCTAWIIYLQHLLFSCMHDIMHVLFFRVFEGHANPCNFVLCPRCHASPGRDLLCPWFFAQIPFFNAFMFIRLSPMHALNC